MRENKSSILILEFFDKNRNRIEIEYQLYRQDMYKMHKEMDRNGKVKSIMWIMWIKIINHTQDKNE